MSLLHDLTIIFSVAPAPRDFKKLFNKVVQAGYIVINDPSLITRTMAWIMTQGINDIFLVESMMKLRDLSQEIHYPLILAAIMYLNSKPKVRRK